MSQGGDSHLLILNKILDALERIEKLLDREGEAFEREYHAQEHGLKSTTDDMKPRTKTLEGELVDVFGEQILEFVMVTSSHIVDQTKYMKPEKWNPVNIFLKDKGFKHKSEGGKRDPSGKPYRAWWVREVHEP